VFILPTAFRFKSCFERCMSSKCSFPKSESNRTQGIFPKTQPQTTHGSHLTCTETNTIWEVTDMVVLQHWGYWLDDSDTMTSGGRNLHCLPFWVLPVSSRTQNVIKKLLLFLLKRAKQTELLYYFRPSVGHSEAWKNSRTAECIFMKFRIGKYY
jgi:hypothetical protein